MRVALLLPLALLAACSNRAEEEARELEEHRARFFEIGREMGHTDAELEGAWRVNREASNDPEIQHAVEEKQKVLDDLRADQCARHPHLDGC